VETFPLNASGKVDRAALPPPRPREQAVHVPPDTLIEMLVTDLYATVLRRERVGVTDSFFDLGGNSLAAMRLIALMGTELQVDVGAAGGVPGPDAAAARGAAAGRARLRRLRPRCSGRHSGSSPRRCRLNRS